MGWGGPIHQPSLQPPPRFIAARPTHQPPQLPLTFCAKILKSPAKGGWTYVIWRHSAAFFGTRGLVKVIGTVDGHRFTSAFMPMGGGVHKLPIAAALRKAIRKDEGSTVTVTLEQRLN